MNKNLIIVLALLTGLLNAFGVTNAYAEVDSIDGAASEIITPKTTISRKTLRGIASSAGIELGGNGALLISDPTVQAFGAGAGYQGSAFFTTWDDRKIGGKFRIETVSMRQEAAQKTNTSFLIPGSSLKSLKQSWTVLSLGAEGHFVAQSQTVFWEGMLGYGIGSTSCNVGVTSGLPDQPITELSQSCSNGFIVSGGVGIKKLFGEHIVGIMSVRTMFLLGPIYNSTSLSSKTLIPFPIMFSVGAAVPFGLGN